eukprot:gene2376-2938_t
MKVTLHVYDLSRGLAKQFSGALFGKTIDGVWHTGIVCFGLEWYYGGGILSDSPSQTPYGVPVEAIELGETEIPRELFEEFLSGIRPKFSMNKYHLIENNCNHFTNECSQFLLGTSIPSYISGLPTEFINSPIGAMLNAQGWGSSMGNVNTQQQEATPFPQIPLFNNMNNNYMNNMNNNNNNSSKTITTTTSVSTTTTSTNNVNHPRKKQGHKHSKLTTPLLLNSKPVLFENADIPSVLNKLTEFSTKSESIDRDEFEKYKLQLKTIISNNDKTIPVNLDLIKYFENLIDLENGDPTIFIEVLRILMLRVDAHNYLTSTSNSTIKNIIKKLLTSPNTLPLTAKLVSYRVINNCFAYNNGKEYLFKDENVLGDLVEVTVNGLHMNDKILKRTVSTVSYNTSIHLEQDNDHKISLFSAVHHTLLNEPLSEDPEIDFRLLMTLGTLLYCDDSSMEILSTLEFDYSKYDKSIDKIKHTTKSKQQQPPPNNNNNKKEEELKSKQIKDGFQYDENEILPDHNKEIDTNEMFNKMYERMYQDTNRMEQELDRVDKEYKEQSKKAKGFFYHLSKRYGELSLLGVLFIIIAITFRAYARKKYNQGQMKQVDFYLTEYLQLDTTQYTPSIAFSWVPKSEHNQDQKDKEKELSDDKKVQQFCFPESPDVLESLCLNGYESTEMFSFVLTDSTGGKSIAYCKRKFQHNQQQQKTTPICYCFIMKKPYFKFFDRVFNVIESKFEKKSKYSIHSLLTSLLTYSLPKSSTTIEVKLGGSSHNSSNIQETLIFPFLKPRSDYDHISYEIIYKMKPAHIIKLFESTLTESRVILLSSNISIVSNAILALSSLLYPLYWQHIFISILPSALMPYVAAPIPFLVGILESSLKSFYQQPTEQVILYNLDKLEFMIDPNIPSQFPHYLRYYLEHSLKKMKSENPNYTGEFDNVIRKPFFSTIYHLFKNYSSFMVKSEDSFIFNKDQFLESYAGDQPTKKLLEMVCNSQMVEMFFSEKASEFTESGDLNHGICSFLNQQTVTQVDIIPTTLVYGKKQALNKNDCRVCAESTISGGGGAVEFSNFTIHKDCLKCQTCSTTLIDSEREKITYPIFPVTQEIQSFKFKKRAAPPEPGLGPKSTSLTKLPSSNNNNNTTTTSNPIQVPQQPSLLLPPKSNNNVKKFNLQSNELASISNPNLFSLSGVKKPTPGSSSTTSSSSSSSSTTTTTVDRSKPPLPPTPDERKERAIEQMKKHSSGMYPDLASTLSTSDSSPTSYSPVISSSQQHSLYPSLPLSSSPVSSLNSSPQQLYPPLLPPSNQTGGGGENRVVQYTRPLPGIPPPFPTSTSPSNTRNEGSTLLEVLKERRLQQQQQQISPLKYSSEELLVNPDNHHFGLPVPTSLNSSGGINRPSSPPKPPTRMPLKKKGASLPSISPPIKNTDPNNNNNLPPSPPLFNNNCPIPSPNTSNRPLPSPPPQQQLYYHQQQYNYHPPSSPSDLNKKQSSPTSPRKRSNSPVSFTNTAMPTQIPIRKPLPSPSPRQQPQHQFNEPSNENSIIQNVPPPLPPKQIQQSQSKSINTNIPPALPIGKPLDSNTTNYNKISPTKLSPRKQPPPPPISPRTQQTNIQIPTIITTTSTTTTSNNNSNSSSPTTQHKLPIKTSSIIANGNKSSPEKSPRRLNKYCFGCKEQLNCTVPIMMANGNYYHLDCFTCFKCQLPLQSDYFFYNGSLYHISCVQNSLPNCTRCSNKIHGRFLEDFKKSPFHEACFTCNNCNRSLMGIGYQEYYQKYYCQPCGTQY